MDLANPPRPDSLPPIPVRAADPSRGTNQAGVRLYIWRDGWGGKSGGALRPGFVSFGLLAAGHAMAASRRVLKAL